MSRAAGNDDDHFDEWVGSAPVSDATVARLPVYLRTLRTLANRGVGTVSSDELAAATGVTPAKLRKDLSHLRANGIRGVGYDVAHLVRAIEVALGQSREWPVAVVGIGNLGHALANFGGFSSRGFRVAALFDVDPRICGAQVAGLRIAHMDTLEATVAAQGISIAVIAVPGAVAQAVADRVMSAGITSILSFATTSVSVPPHVALRKVDLATELHILAFREHRKASVTLPESLDPPARPSG